MTDWRDRFFDALVRPFHGQMVLLIGYGSLSEGGDADYFAIYDDLPKLESLKAGGVDFWAIGQADLTTYVGLMDPFVTEPFLTGSLLHGPTATFESIRSDISQTESTSEAVRYLLLRSFHSYTEVCGHLGALSESRDIPAREFWSLLSFSISYWCYARCYASESRRAVTLKKAIANSPQEVRNLWNEVLEAKSAESPPLERSVTQWSRILVDWRD